MVAPTRLRAIGTAVLWLCTAAPATASGPFEPVLIFTPIDRPDAPLQRFLQGELGVLRPTYAPTFLFAAYRQLSGLGFDPAAQAQILALWNEKLGQGDANETAAAAQLGAWNAARAGAAESSDAPRIGLYRDDPIRPVSYLNCAPDAFRSAARTLAARIETFGRESAAVRAWLSAQDQVFANCSGAVPQIPVAAPPDAPLLVHADRAYQIAAAYFYAGRFAEAEARFGAITRDPTSPWSRIAPYLAARALIRQATLAEDFGFDAAILRNAETALQKILGEVELDEIHPAAEALLEFVRFRLHPEERLHELAGALLQERLSPGVAHRLWDYRLLLDPPWINRIQRFDDLTDWILTLPDRRPAALEHALQRWTETRSFPWRVAALAKIAPGHPRLAELLAAAEVPPNHPAAATVAFYRIRLLSEAGDRRAARLRLDRWRARAPDQLPPAAVNAFRAQSLALARNLREFIEAAPRIPVRAGYGDADVILEPPADGPATPLARRLAEGAEWLDLDAVDTINEK